MRTISSSEAGRLNIIRNLLRRKETVSIIVDGPNLLRKVGSKQLKLDDIDRYASQLGNLGEKYVLLNRHASEALIQAVINSGYTPIVATEDVHIRMGLLVLEIAKRNTGNIILLGSRDARCTPILMKLKEKGIKTAILGFDPGFSISLKNVADITIDITKER